MIITEKSSEVKILDAKILDAKAEFTFFVNILDNPNVSEKVKEMINKYLEKVIYGYQTPILRMKMGGE